MGGSLLFATLAQVVSSLVTALFYGVVFGGIMTLVAAIGDKKSDGTTPAMALGIGIGAALAIVLLSVFVGIGTLFVVNRNQLFALKESGTTSATGK